VETDSHLRRLRSFELDCRPPYDRVEPVPAGTAVRVRYRRGTGRVLKVWTVPEPPRAPADAVPDGV
jgi:hypothetical protein